MVLSVSEQTFTQEVLESSVPVLVDFGAPWCGLCRMIQPLLLQFQARCGEQIKLVTVNADENFKLANAYRLTTLPTLILIEEGKVQQRIDNFHQPDDLRLMLEATLVSYKNRRATYAGTQPTLLTRSGLSHAADLECRLA